MSEQNTDEDGKIGILIKLDQTVVEEIDRRCGGKGGGRGRVTGRSRWLRTLVHKALKIPLEESPSVEEEIDIQHVDAEALDRKTKLIVTLYRKGYVCGDIAAWLQSENIPPSRGGSWTKQAVKRVLVRLARKAAIEQAQRTGAPIPGHVPRRKRRAS